MLNPPVIKNLGFVSLIISLVPPYALPAAQEITATSITSRYSELTNPPCRTTMVHVEGATSEQMCPGIFGYRLKLLDSDGRMSVTVVSPSGREWPLDFWKTVGSHFSTVGPKAEWIIPKLETRSSPVAIVVPLEIQEDPESAAHTFYLVVAKIGSDRSCVVRTLKQKDVSVADVRRIADRAGELPCESR